MQGPQTIGGLRVFVQPDQPKMQLSSRVKEVLSPEFAAETDAWMLSFFGITNMLPDGEVIVAKAAGFMTMNPRTFAQLRGATGSHP